MITLETNQPCLLEPHWLVVTGGDFAPDELVTCKKTDDPSQECAMYALFISTGEYPA